MSESATSVPAEAIEVAALAWLPSGHHDRCAGTNPCGCYFQRYRRQAEIFLTAAAPILLAAERGLIASELRAVASTYRPIARKALIDEANRIDRETTDDGRIARSEPTE